MALTGARFRRRKKEVWFGDGYFIDHANDVVPGMDQQDETFHLFGKESPETDKQQNYGTLQIGLLDKYVNNALLDLICGQDPAATTPKQYKVEDAADVDMWANVKDKKNTKYIRALLMSGWTPGIPLPSGAPNDKAVYQMTGNCDLPRSFENCWIDAKKVASGGAMSLGVTPIEVPGETGIYAIRVKGIDQTSGFKQEAVTPTASMVSSIGGITPSAVLAACQELTALTHVYVVFLRTGNGIYPTIAPDKLRA